MLCIPDLARNVPYSDGDDEAKQTIFNQTRHNKDWMKAIHGRY